MKIKRHLNLFSMTALRNSSFMKYVNCFWDYKKYPSRVIHNFYHSFILAILFIAISSANVAALPVFPGAKGFGSATSAGRGGMIYKVTNLNNSGIGSLRGCVNLSGPRICVFEISGTIFLDENLKITNPYLTIAGQTAPSPGITLRGRSLIISNTHDVLIQHLRIRVGDMISSNLDGIEVTNDSYNIVIDHCSVSWAIDENIDAVYGSHDVTYSNCISSEALHDSVHSKGRHSKGLMVARAKNISIINNLIAHNNDRNIQLGKADNGLSAAFVNSVIYNWGSSGTRVTDAGRDKFVSIVGNVYISGGNSKAGKKPIFVYRESGPKVFINDNMWNGSVPADPWGIVHITGTGGDPRVSSPYVWPAGFEAMNVIEVKEYVLNNVGARPADRDAVDKRIVNDVRNGTGRIINSQEEVGGWPDLEFNYRALTIPDNPHGDNDQDGYTNVEEWLHDYAAIVEGKNSDSTAPNPPKELKTP